MNKNIFLTLFLLSSFFCFSQENIKYARTIKVEDLVEVKGITKNQNDVIKEYKKGKCLFYMVQLGQVRPL